MEYYQLHDSLKRKLQDNLDKYKDNVPKVKGYSLIQNLVTIGATEGQLKKLKTWYENESFKTENAKQLDLYGKNSLRSFVNNTLNRIRTKAEMGKHVKKMTAYPSLQGIYKKTHNKDRQNTVSGASVKPAEVRTSSTYRDMMHGEAFQHELNRITELIEHICLY